MAPLFYPSKRRGINLNAAITSSLVTSLDWCISQLGIVQCQKNNIPKSWNPLPVDFGFYYELAYHLMAEGDDATHLLSTEKLTQIVQRFNASFKQINNAQSFSVTTLRSPYYEELEIACFIKWLDLEPHNAMCLTALTDTELYHARSQLMKACDALCILAPEFYEEFLSITKEVILARPSGEQKLTFGGASSFFLWGALILNIDAHQDWYTYLPSLVHEYSHNLLFGLAKNAPLVLNDPNDLYYSPLRQESRPMDGIYHAAFVSAREAIAMQQALDKMNNKIVVKEDLLAIKDYCARVQQASSNVFWDCLFVLEKEGILSDLGKQIMADTKSAMNSR